MNLNNNPTKLVLAFLSLGIVFGDIGTSPLYALKETFFGHYQIATSYQNILGALSLFFWSLTVIVTFKYILLIMRADNDGEGGIFSLLGLIKRSESVIPARLYSAIILLILFGAGLLYGDGIITPAISVLSAVGGLEVATPALKNAVVSITLVILFLLFAVQKRGTARVAGLFSPVMAVWFLFLIGLAIPQLLKYPEVFSAVNPLYGFNFLLSHGFKSLWIIGAVVLCITGVEALYADLGHFGRGPITRAWVFFVYPALLVNYFGQGARLLDPTPILNNNLFYSLVPNDILWPAIFLSTAATIIASQALISGCYSLTHQAMALGVFPRIKILHTNPDIKGQIYIPFINWALFVGSALLVVFFKNPSNLAVAYGIAVTGTMAITTMAFFVVAVYRWHWPRYYMIPVCGLLIGIDLTFFLANTFKFFQGGYVPVVIGVAMFGVMWIWRWGRHMVRRAYVSYGKKRKMSWFIELKGRLIRDGGVMRDDRPRRLVESDRVAVFMSSHPVSKPEDDMPIALRVHLKRDGVMPKYVIILTIIQEKVPFVSENKHSLFNLGNNILSIQARFGFMENPSARDILRELRSKGVISEDLHRCTIEVGEEELIVHPGATFKNRILSNVYEYIYRFTVPAHHYFGLRDVSGVAKTIVPIIIDKEGVRVDIPEFAFSAKEEAEAIDPDTLKPTEIEFTEIT